MSDQFWTVFLANLPLLAGFFWALHKKYIFMGVTVIRELDEKDRQIAFREQLRQEALADKAALAKTNREVTASLNELSSVVKQTLELNDTLLNENLDHQRWDG